MEKKIRQLAARGWPIAVAGILLIGCVIIGVSGGLYLLLRDDNEGPPTIPILVDKTPDGGQVSGVTSVIAVTDGFSEPDGGEGRLHIRLSKGQAEPQESEPTHLLTGEPLSDEEIERLLNRLPELFIDPRDSVDFRLPAPLILKLRAIKM